MARIPIIMPQFGEAVAEVTVREWLVAPGDVLSRDQIIAEVETEKAVLELIAPCDGTCLELLAAVGDACDVGATVAWIEGEGETTTTEGEPADAPREAESAVAAALPKAALPPQRETTAFFSPRVRQLMADRQLSPSDLTQIRGGGANGRVRSRDLEAFLEYLEDSYEEVPISRLRRFVADTMQRSWQRPIATIAARVRMDPILAHRRTIAGRPSASIYALRALGLALREAPEAAQLILGQHYFVPKQIDLGLAVEVEDGVLTPVVREVDTLDLARLTEQVADLQQRALDRRLDPDATRGGIATVSNYGSLKITWATPLPVDTQSLIFGIGSVQRVPEWNPATSTWDCARASEVTLSFDHRIVDGAGSARLLHAIVRYLEHPETL